MDTENKYYGLIKNLVEQNKKYTGLESLLNDIIDDVFKRSESIINNIDDENVIEEYISKVVTTSIINVSRKNKESLKKEHSNNSTEHYTEKKTVSSVDTSLIDKMINLAMSESINNKQNEIKPVEENTIDTEEEITNTYKYLNESDLVDENERQIGYSEIGDISDLNNISVEYEVNNNESKSDITVIEESSFEEIEQEEEQPEEGGQEQEQSNVLDVESDIVQEEYFSIDATDTYENTAPEGIEISEPIEFNEITDSVDNNEIEEDINSQEYIENDEGSELSIIDNEYIDETTSNNEENEFNIVNDEYIGETSSENNENSFIEPDNTFELVEPDENEINIDIINSDIDTTYDKNFEIIDNDNTNADNEENKVAVNTENEPASIEENIEITENTDTEEEPDISSDIDFTGDSDINNDAFDITISDISNEDNISLDGEISDDIIVNDDESEMFSIDTDEADFSLLIEPSQEEQTQQIIENKTADFSVFRFETMDTNTIYDTDKFFNAISELNNNEPGLHISEICDLRFNRKKSVIEIAVELGIDAGSVIDVLNKLNTLNVGDY